MDLQYVYLIQEREFIKTNEKIYKIGRTKQLNNLRILSCPKGSNLLAQISCCDCVKVENEIIQLFNTKYIKRTDIGNEYFEGNEFEMMKDMFNIIANKNTDTLKMQYN
jgi:hypothetical protein